MADPSLSIFESRPCDSVSLVSSMVDVWVYQNLSLSKFPDETHSKCVYDSVKHGKFSCTSRCKSIQMYSNWTISQDWIFDEQRLMAYRLIYAMDDYVGNMCTYIYWICATQWICWNVLGDWWITIVEIAINKILPASQAMWNQSTVLSWQRNEHFHWERCEYKSNRCMDTLKHIPTYAMKIHTYRMNALRIIWMNRNSTSYGTETA